MKFKNTVQIRETYFSEIIVTIIAIRNNYWILHLDKAREKLKCVKRIVIVTALK